uniref:Uncharacterized protein n=1 Tax=Setaria italica TaxID=4555 RepID=K3YNR3_SETIT
MKVGTGRSRTDRHRIPRIPIEYWIYGKNRNRKKNPGKPGENRDRNWLERFPDRILGSRI